MKTEKQEGTWKITFWYTFPNAIKTAVVKTNTQHWQRLQPTIFLLSAELHQSKVCLF